MLDWSQLANRLLEALLISGVLGLFLHWRTQRMSAEIRMMTERALDRDRSERSWRERSLAELLGPVAMQLARSKRAYERWDRQNLLLEGQVIAVANRTIRDLLLTNGHLIPPELHREALELVEHYDVWLEAYTRLREQAKDTQQAFVFVASEGYPFPREAAKRFWEAYKTGWDDLYGEEASAVRNA